MPAKDFLTLEEENDIIDAIRAAELKTSGEIRVHIETHNPIADPYERALEVFEKLGMHNTQSRNAVLFYVAVDDHNFVIFGDEGINEVVPDDFWEKTKDLIVSHFRQGNFKQGLVEGILKAGRILKNYFPYGENDKNELPDEISKGLI
ncbi:MAG: TPM domain-containing protein [Capnocytophaga sp.]|nr:TPM domain-containing protein [Capnocytophaga sp.]